MVDLPYDHISHAGIHVNQIPCTYSNNICIDFGGYALTSYTASRQGLGVLYLRSSTVGDSLFKIFHLSLFVIE